MAWSRVQSAVTAATASAISSVAATYGTNLTSGTKLIAVVTTSTQTGTSTTVSTVKDASSNSFTLIGRKSQPSTGTILTDVSLWAIDTPSGDAGSKPTITATLGSGTANMGILLQEVSGLAAGNTTAAMIDGTLAGLGGSGSSGSTGSPSYTSTASSEYLVSCYGDDGGPLTWTKPSALTSDTNSVNSSSFANCALAYGNSTNGAEAGSWAITGSIAEWATLLVAFKLASGNATVPGVPAALSLAAPAGSVSASATVAGTAASLTLAAPAGQVRTTANVAGTVASLTFAAPAGSVTVTPPHATAATYHGLFTRGYLQYTDLENGLTLVARQGNTYYLNTASGQTDLTTPPSDGWWTVPGDSPPYEGPFSSVPGLATPGAFTPGAVKTSQHPDMAVFRPAADPAPPEHFTARDKLRWRQRRLTQRTWAAMASRTRTRS